MKSTPSSASSIFLLGLGTGLTGVFCNEPRTVGFDQVPFLQNSHRAKNFADDACHRCFPSSRIAAENHVQAEFRGRQADFFAMALHFKKICERVHLVLDILQPDQAIEFCHGFFERELRRNGFGFLTLCGICLNLDFTGVSLGSGLCRMCVWQFVGIMQNFFNGAHSCFIGIFMLIGLIDRNLAQMSVQLVLNGFYERRFARFHRTVGAGDDISQPGDDGFELGNAVS